MANEYISKVTKADGEILIDLTGDDIKPEHVEKGILFHDKSGAPKTGTSTKTVDASGVTAEAAEVLDGKTFGKGASVQTGTMPNIGSQKGTISAKASKVTISRGYHDGTGAVEISDAEKAKLIPANIKEGVEILGVVGDFGADDISSQHKEVTPTFADQEISPDSGYTFLSSVKVKAIPITRQDNAAGGVTVTIG